MLNTIKTLKGGDLSRGRLRKKPQTKGGKLDD